MPVVLLLISNIHPTKPSTYLQHNQTVQFTPLTFSDFLKQSKKETEGEFDFMEDAQIRIGP